MSGSTPSIDAVVVTFESAHVLEGCLDSLARSAPDRGVRTVVVDNDSADDSVALAISRLGPGNVVRCARNGGFAAGVNAGLRATGCGLVAVINPDVRIPAGGLDRLAGILETHPRAGLVGPRVRRPSGGFEDTAGRFPTLARERAHAFLLDRIPGVEGRRRTFPQSTGDVDWISGCGWMLRRAAVDDVGALDEGYFMYYEDVDFCRRLRDAGWAVLATPEVEFEHAVGQGSRATARLPADGGASLLRYARKFLGERSAEELRGILAAGWRIRRAARRVLAALGDRRSAALLPRYQLALEAVSGR